METTLVPDDYVFLEPTPSQFVRGSIVVFYPLQEDEPAPSVLPPPYLKRVIGLPGDSVALQDGNVT